MRGIFRRNLRLELVAMLGIVLAMPALAASGAATTTALTAGALSSSCAQTLSVTVTSSGSAASGIVTIQDEFNGDTVQLGSVALSSGTASPQFSLANGTHVLTANYVGNSTYASSSSSSVSVSVNSTCNFMPAVTNFTPATTPVNTLTAGESGTATVSLIPLSSYTSSLSEPVSVTLSCSGLPDAATCSFTPATVQITSSTTSVTSSMVIQTVASSSSALSPANRRGREPSPIAWAFLLPGVLGLGGLAWGTRRRSSNGQPRKTIIYWLNRSSLIALVGLVTLIGTTACNPRYDYYNHGPSSTSATPSGTYTLKVTGQSGDGTIRSTNFAFTVN